MVRSQQLIALIVLHSPNTNQKGGRSHYPLVTMQRIHLLQQRYLIIALAMEELITHRPLQPSSQLPPLRSCSRWRTLARSRGAENVASCSGRSLGAEPRRWPTLIPALLVEQLPRNDLWIGSAPVPIGAFGRWEEQRAGGDPGPVGGRAATLMAKEAMV